MEDEVDRFVFGAEFFLNVHLGIVENDGAQLYIARFVNTVHVTKSSSNRELVADFHQLFVGVGHFFGLGVEAGAVYVGVVYAVFLTAGDAQLDFQRHAHFAHAFQVALADFNVFGNWLFG